MTPEEIKTAIRLAARLDAIEKLAVVLGFSVGSPGHEFRYQIVHRLGVRTVDDVRALPAPLYFAGLCRVIEWESLAEWSSRSVWPLSAPLVALHATPAGRAAILTMLRGSEVRTAAGLCNWLRQETWKAA